MCNLSAGDILGWLSVLLLAGIIVVLIMWGYAFNVIGARRG
jgi:hypothetical protein